MPNFFTFDDGRSYVALSEIESFGHQEEGDFKGGTWIKLRNDEHVLYVRWDVTKVAELLGPIANLHY